MKRIISAAVALGLVGILVAMSVAVQAPAGGRQDPFPAYNFLVELEGVAVATFQEVSGLKCETEVIEYREGGDTGTVRLLPGITRCGPIVLTRGVTANTELSDWFWQTATGNVLRKNGAVVILDRSNTEVARYNFYEAWPAKWSLSELDAGSGGHLVEKIEIVCEWIERAK